MPLPNHGHTAKHMYNLFTNKHFYFTRNLNMFNDLQTA